TVTQPPPPAGRDEPLVMLTPEDADYPSRLRRLPSPRPIDTSGPLDRSIAIAVVGARRATPEALAFTSAVAETLARAGVVVISGGAEGVDTAAHRGALASGGRTWVVAPTGRDHVY